jgi:hypothetical protein
MQYDDALVEVVAFEMSRVILPATREMPRDDALYLWQASPEEDKETLYLAARAAIETMILIGYRMDEDASPLGQ